MSVIIPVEVIPMKQVDVYRLAVKLLKKMAKENPGKSFQFVNDIFG